MTAPTEKGTQAPPPPQQIWVFQQNKSGEGKIKGIRRHGGEAFNLEVVSINQSLPPFIDDADSRLPDPLGADLVLDYLRHPDLSHALAEKCLHLAIPMIAAGKKPPVGKALTPRVCCALTQKEGLGGYGLHFGLPEYEVIVEEGQIIALRTLRGAPCGATWDAGQRMVGLSAQESAARIGLETQFSCKANPADWDPITGKSPVHIAAELHKAALVRALINSRSRTNGSHA